VTPSWQPAGWISEKDLNSCTCRTRLIATTAFSSPTRPRTSIFAYVGTRTTGTQAGDYLVTGPNWTGQVPSGTKQISSPNNSVPFFGRVLVYADSDLPTAHDLAKQIQLSAPPNPSNDSDTTP
jgi:Uncharacterized conserved protein